MTNTFSFYCFVAVEKGPLNTAKIIFAVEIFIAGTTLRLDQQTLNPTILERLWTMNTPLSDRIMTSLKVLNSEGLERPWTLLLLW